MRLPVNKYPLIKLADETSNSELIKTAIDKGVVNFMIEAWTAYSANELRNKNMLDGMTAVGGLDLGGKIIENIEEDFISQYNSLLKEKE